ncbi:zinc finger protein 568-like [Monomorium pharaonis]|uniref:zinc finger protein 568-like n=1 Tax=Monomorium pharaonis TaxID=307658 RepID=UPI001745F778|nr:zinc finger protein 568-like [Monomorium pharaonis]
MWQLQQRVQHEAQSSVSLEDRVRSTAEIQLSILRLQDETSVKQIQSDGVQRFHAHSNQCVYNPDGAQQCRSYPCHKCGSAFTRKNNLYNHLKFQCGQLPRFNCPYCSYRTKHSSNVRSHIRRIHPNESVYVLDISSKQNYQSK